MDAEQTEQTEGFRPPYMSFTTLWSFIDELLSRPLPPRIDRSIMASKSGSDQQNLTTAMKAFVLIDANQNVTGLRALEDSDEAARVAWLAERVRACYPEQLRISDVHGTEQQLRLSFKEGFALDSRETVRKSMTFFLHAARKANIPLSAHFPATRSGSGAPGAPKARRTAKPRAKPSAPLSGNPSSKSGAADKGDVYAVTLNSGGSVRVVVDVNIFELSTEDRQFVINLVDSLKGYPQTLPDDREGETT